MTGRELLEVLKSLDSAELNYVVLSNVNGQWLQLQSISKDFGMKSIDLKLDGE